MGFDANNRSKTSIGSLEIQAIVLDLDGTLVDTLGDFEGALNRALADVDMPAVSRSLVEKNIGKGSEHLIRSVLAHQLALPEVLGCVGALHNYHADTLYESIWQRYQHHYLQINGQFAQNYEGVLPALEQLQSLGWPLACLTNKPLAFAQALLQNKGLHHFFTHVFGGDSFERKKPDPLPLVKTCEALGTVPQYTLMVGDSSNDAQAAHAAGCPVVLMRYGYNHGEPVDAVPAHAHFNSMAELPAWLANNTARIT
jgi:phosphoglycolate phosphatase